VEKVRKISFSVAFSAALDFAWATEKFAQATEKKELIAERIGQPLLTRHQP
jgi:hypothetical protein